jgi:hypothetical protein
MQAGSPTSRQYQTSCLWEGGKRSGRYNVGLYIKNTGGAATLYQFKVTAVAYIIGASTAFPPPFRNNNAPGTAKILIPILVLLLLGLALLLAVGVFVRGRRAAARVSA